LLRTGIEAQRAAEAARIPFGTNYAAAGLITQAHARELIEARRTAITSSLGCWEADTVPVHQNGYKGINLAHTKSRVRGRTTENIGLPKLYMHHLALIADGRRDELSRCTQANSIFQVSHLCHNGGCFNPAHLRVEEAARNRARNSCQGHEIVEYSGIGPMRYHPCPHGGESNAYYRCILPRRLIEQPGRYQNGA
jgi:hypothetical protein